MFVGELEISLAEEKEWGSLTFSLFELIETMDQNHVQDLIHNVIYTLHTSFLETNMFQNTPFKNTQKLVKCQYYVCQYVKQVQ